MCYAGLNTKSAATKKYLKFKGKTAVFKG